MTKQERIKDYMSYGLTKEEAEQIIQPGQESYLSVKQLRAKYHNKNIGNKEVQADYNYPKWLNMDLHLTYCVQVASTYMRTSTIRQFYPIDPNYKSGGEAECKYMKIPYVERVTKEEKIQKGNEVVEKSIKTRGTKLREVNYAVYNLAIDLFSFTLPKINLFENENHLKVALINRCKSIVRDGIKAKTMPIKKKDLSKEEQEKLKGCDEWYTGEYRGQDRIALSLDEPVKRFDNMEDDSQTYEEYIMDKSCGIVYDNIELLSKINGFKNKEIRDFLIIVGNIIGDLDQFNNAYKEVLSTYDKEVQDDINKLKNRQVKSISQKSKIIVNERRVNQVKIEEIVGAMGLDWLESVNGCVEENLRRAILGKISKRDGKIAKADTVKRALENVRDYIRYYNKDLSIFFS